MALHKRNIAINILILVLLRMEKYDFRFVSGEGRCIKREREALLRFKKGLISGVLSSWGSEDHNKECCKWEGVYCSNTSGHVIALKLRGYGDQSSDLRGNISSALLELHHLIDLDLSSNYFGYDRIPEFIGSMEQLEHLNLSMSSFSGIVPPQLGNLTNLRTLDLSKNLLTSSTFDWLFNISTSLVKLDLSRNALDGPIPDAFGRLVSLEYLDFSRNMLEGEIPKSLGNSTHLQILSLSSNNLRGHLVELFVASCKVLVSPEATACSELRLLYIGKNELIGSLPVSLGQHSKLELVDVSFNSLQGTISEAHFTKLHNLEVLDLSFNSLTFQIGAHWNPPFQLYAIALAGCNMGPHFPKWIHTQISINLRWLDLSHAGISDEIPEWFWSFSSEPSFLNISYNQISGTIPDLSSTSIHAIDVSSNKFSGPIPLFHPNTSILRFGQNMFSGSIASICTNPPSMLDVLDLSNNQLAGELPNCWEKMTNLAYLNLANNSFSGEIPHSLGSLQYLNALHLRDNNLSGGLPSALKNCQDLYLVDFGGNKLTGNIPVWFGANYPYLIYMSLRDNRFYGSIPPQICSLPQIQILDLSMNNLSGQIPLCFNNFSLLVSKEMPSIADFSFWLVYPTEISYVIVGHYSEYASVQWKGKESGYGKNLELLKLIDLSSNRLVGSIPGSFSSLRGLISLNLSRNNLTGNIFPDIGQMEMLECLDLSRNQLSGEIPVGLAELHYLAVLDLAKNNLSGQIPSGTQLQSFNASVYAENADLCGRPLKLCPKDGHNASITNEGKNNKEKHNGFLSLSFMQEFGIAMAFGFIIGFWGVVGSLLMKKSWRSAYFNFWDTIGDWLYAATIIFLGKFRRN